MTKNADNFATRLRTLRAARDQSQADLASALGCGQTTVSLWESGASDPSAASVRALALHFGCTADYLIGLSDHPHVLRPGDWVIDLELVENRRLGKDVKGRLWAVAVPANYRIVSSSEYAQLADELRSLSGTRTGKQKEKHR